MKIKDFISKSIQEYPSLYKDIDYERSKLKVLNHIFFTIGNGLEMAETDDGKEGGYVVDPKYKKDKNDEWIRIKDKPYGKDKHGPIPEGYFENVIYYVHAGDIPLETIYKKDEYGNDKVYFRYDKKVDSEFKKPKLYKAECRHSFSPYPFSKNYSLACDVFYENVFLQDDWMTELLFLCEKTLEYFKDESRYISDPYYPNKKDIEYDMKCFKERLNSDGLKGLKDLKKIWGYEMTDKIPSYDEIKERKNEIWKKYHKAQSNFLTKFIKKYKKFKF